MDFKTDNQLLDQLEAGRENWVLVLLTGMLHLMDLKKPESGRKLESTSSDFSECLETD